MITLTTFGEPLIAFVANTLGPTHTVDRWDRFVVGAESNVAVAATRLGLNSRYLCRVGNDPMGDVVLRFLRSEGVDTSGVKKDIQAPTGVLIRNRSKTGSSDVAYYRSDSAGSRIHPDDVSIGGDTNWLHLSGITPALSSSAAEATTSAIEQARASEASISLDINYREKLWDRADASSVLGPLARQVDVVFGSQSELALVSQDEGADLLRESNVELVVLRGQTGLASATSKSNRVEFYSDMKDPVDPVGAGDAFTAGFMVAFLEGLDLKTALEWGHEAGKSVAMTLGDTTGLPARAELLRSLSHSSDTAR